MKEVYSNKGDLNNQAPVKLSLRIKVYYGIFQSGLYPTVLKLTIHHIEEELVES